MKKYMYSKYKLTFEEEAPYLQSLRGIKKNQNINILSCDKDTLEIVCEEVSTTAVVDY